MKGREGPVKIRRSGTEGRPVVSPELQLILGPYTMAAGVAAYVKHVERHPQ